MRLLLFCVLNLITWSTAHAADANCAKLNIVSGSSCKYLNVQFDFSACPNGAKDPVAGEMIRCEAGRPTAIAKRPEGIYEAELKAPGSPNGVWSVAGIKIRGSKSSERAQEKVAKLVAAPAAPTPAPVTSTTPANTQQAPAVPATPPAPAPVNLTQLKVNGHFRARYENSNRTNLANKRDFTLLRVRPAVSFQVNPNVLVLLEPQFARTLGENALPAGSATPAVSSGSTVDPDFSVHQAFGEYKSDALSFRVGRQILAYGDELILGALEWNNIGRTFDAMKVRYSHGLGWMDAFTSKISETNAATAGAGDKDFHGFYSSMDLGSALKNLDFYVLYLEDSGLTRAQKIGTFGLRAKSNLGNFFYRLEADTQWESSAGEDAYQADFETGWQSSAPHKTLFSIEGFTSGRTYTQMYPTAHKWLGYADVFGRRNISGGVFHFSTQPTSKLSAQLDYHYFQRTSDSATPVKLDGTTAIGTATASTSKELGSEIDLTLSYDVLPGLTAMGGYSILFFGDYMNEQFRYSNVSFAFLQILTKF